MDHNMTKTEWKKLGEAVLELFVKYAAFFIMPLAPALPALWVGQPYLPFTFWQLYGLFIVFAGICGFIRNIFKH